jgi:hypothetical protein
MIMNEIQRKLPDTVEEFKQWRETKPRRTLNDFVEQLHLELYNNQRYFKLLDGTTDEDTVEGSCGADNVLAAMMLRDLAKEKAIKEVAEKKIATIVKSLGVVLSRYKATRKQRRNTVGGVYVPPENGE